MTDLSTTAQTALRAIRLIRQYDLATSAEAETLVLQKLSAQDMTAVVLALSESQETRSPSERVNHILDRLVISRSAEFQTYTDKIIRLREANPELELSTDPKQIRLNLESQYKDRTRDFCRALIRAGLSDNVIAGLWPIFERSEKNRRTHKRRTCYDDRHSRRIPRPPRRLLGRLCRRQRAGLEATPATVVAPGTEARHRGRAPPAGVAPSAGCRAPSQLVPENVTMLPFLGRMPPSECILRPARRWPDWTL